MSDYDKIMAIFKEYAYPIEVISGRKILQIEESQFKSLITDIVNMKAKPAKETPEPSLKDIAEKVDYLYRVQKQKEPTVRQQPRPGYKRNLNEKPVINTTKGA